MQAQAVRADQARHVGRHIQPQADRAAAQLRLEQAHDTVEGGDDVERFRARLELTGLDLGEIQHVVHHPEQRGAGVLQPLRVGLLLGLQGSAQQHVGIADDGVHRRAHLMAHVGDEVRLGGIGGFGGLQGQAGLGLPADGFLQVLALQGLAVQQLGHLAAHLQPHARKGLHQHAQLVLAVGVEGHVVVGGMDVARRLGQGGQRPREGMAEGGQQGREYQQAQHADQRQGPQQRLPRLRQRAARQPELHLPQHLPAHLQWRLEVQAVLRGLNRGGLGQAGSPSREGCGIGPAFRNHPPGGIAHADKDQIARGARLGEDGRDSGEVTLRQGGRERRVEQGLELPHPRREFALQVAVHQGGHAHPHCGQHQHLQQHAHADELGAKAQPVPGHAQRHGLGLSPRQGPGQPPRSARGHGSGTGSSFRA